MSKLRRTAQSSTRLQNWFSMLALAGGIVHFHPTFKLGSPRSRFLGTDPEPRPGLSSGHIPNSFSLPFNLFLTQNTNIMSGETYTTFKSRDQILDELKKAAGEEETRAILEGKRKVVTSCGSGMTAGVLWLGLNLLGVKGVALYDEVCRSVLIPSAQKANWVLCRVGLGTRRDPRAKS